MARPAPLDWSRTTPLMSNLDGAGAGVVGVGVVGDAGVPLPHPAMNRHSASSADNRYAKNSPKTGLRRSEMRHPTPTQQQSLHGLSDFLCWLVSRRGPSETFLVVEVG